MLFPTALEDMIPHDHPVRLVDEILDTLDWTAWEATYHGALGQPPIHPAMMAKILLFAMIRRLRSSRQMEIDGTRVLASNNRYKTWTAEKLARALELLDGQIFGTNQLVETLANERQYTCKIVLDVKYVYGPLATTDLHADGNFLRRC